MHNKDYMIGAGQTAKNVPGFVAWVYVYNQAVKAAQADNKFGSWNEEGFRKEYFDRFVAGVDTAFEIVQEKSEPAVTTFEAPEPGTGRNYPDGVTPETPEAPKRGRPTTKV